MTPETRENIVMDFRPLGWWERLQVAWAVLWGDAIVLNVGRREM